MNIVPMKEMKGYWKEMNEMDEVISICKMKRVEMKEFVISIQMVILIEQVNGRMVKYLLKRFEGKKMIEFVNGVKRYE